MRGRGGPERRTRPAEAGGAAARVRDAMSRAGLALLGAAACGALATGAARAQTPDEPPSFAAGVELVTIDAVVLDAEGEPVSGLGPGDFVVEEDGRPREIATFEVFDFTRASAPAPVARSAERTEPREQPTGRAFAILVDDLGIQRSTGPTVREAVASFLQRSVGDGDEVILATTSGSAWWPARLPEGREDLLAVLSRVEGRHLDVVGIDYMSDYEAYWIANFEDSPSMRRARPGSRVALTGRASVRSDSLPPGLEGVRERVMDRWERAGVCGETACDARVRNRAAELDARRRGRVRATLQAVRRQLEALTPVPGRKSLLLLSEGFVHDPTSGVRKVVSASRVANTAVYFLDVRGLIGRPGFGSAADPRQPPDPRVQAAMAFEETTAAAEGAEVLADETGGFSVKNTNDIAAGARRVADESRVFYLLGFYPPEGKSPGEWRKLSVAVKRPGLRVRARRGYTLRPPEPLGGDEAEGDADERSLDPAVLRALDSPHEVAGIPLRAMAYLLEPRAEDRVRVVVAVEIDASRFLSDRRKKARLELSVLALGRDSGVGYRQDVALEVSAEASAGVGWRAVARELELPVGVHQVRVAALEAESGAVGATAIRVDVPPADLLHVTTPLLTPGAAPGPAGGAGPQPALSAHRVFAPEGGLYCRFEVIGAARAPDGGPPRVRAGLELWSRDGRRLLAAPPTPIAVDADGRVVRQVALPLGELGEGAYDLILAIEDAVSGARLKRRESFAISRSASR